jgi:hypothetical protein
MSSAGISVDQGCNSHHDPTLTSVVDTQLPDRNQHDGPQLEALPDKRTSKGRRTIKHVSLDFKFDATKLEEAWGDSQ